MKSISNGERNLNQWRGYYVFVKVDCDWWNMIDKFLVGSWGVQVRAIGHGRIAIRKERFEEFKKYYKSLPKSPIQPFKIFDGDSYKAM